MEDFFLVASVVFAAWLTCRAAGTARVAATNMRPTACPLVQRTVQAWSRPIGLLRNTPFDETEYKT